MAGNDVNTLLLLHGEAITDSSIYNDAITNNGVTISDVAKFGKSLAFGSSVSKFSVSLPINLKTSDFTIDWWEYRNSADGTHSTVCTFGQLGTYSCLFAYHYQADILIYASSDGSNWNITSAFKMGNFIANQWVHRAVVRSGGTLYLFENGNLVNTITGASAINIPNNILTFSRCFMTGYFNGYIDEFRVSDVARWTSNFTPPTVAYDYDKPGSIENLVYTINDTDGIDITWDAAEYATQYEISKNGALVATISDTYYTDNEILFGETYVYTVTPFNRTAAGEGASITARTVLEKPDRLSAVLDDNIVTLSWGSVRGAEGYYVHRDGVVVASVTAISYSDILAPSETAEYAVSAYAGSNISELSDTVVVENWLGVMPDLITDRTDADVDEAKRLRDKLIAGEALTDEESARYFAGIRGAYNASDMDRVGAAVRYVANRLNAEGYGAYVSPKTDWHMADIVRQSDWNKYLDEVRHLRRKLTLMRTTPQITDGMYSGLKSYAEANAIEQILVDLDWMLTNIIRNYIYAGEVFAGEV